MPKSLQKQPSFISSRLRKNSEKPKDRIALNDKVPRLPNITKWVMEKIKIKSDSCEIFLNLYKALKTNHFHKFPKQNRVWSVGEQKTHFQSRGVEVEAHTPRVTHWASQACAFLHARDAHTARDALGMRAAHRVLRPENYSPLKLNSNHLFASK